MSTKGVVSPELKQRFDQAVQIVQTLPKAGPILPSYAQKLLLYSLYKQSTSGDLDNAGGSGRPGMLDPVGRAKWDAWNKKRGLQMDEAMAQYVDTLISILQDHPSDSYALEALHSIGAVGGAATGTGVGSGSKEPVGGEEGTRRKGSVRRERIRSRSSSTSSSSSSRSFISSKSSLSASGLNLGVVAAETNGSELLVDRDGQEERVEMPVAVPFTPIIDLIEGPERDGVLVSSADIGQPTGLGAAEVRREPYTHIGASGLNLAPELQGFPGPDQVEPDMDADADSESSISLGGDAQSHHASRTPSVVGKIRLSGMTSAGGAGVGRRGRRRSERPGVNEPGSSGHGLGHGQGQTQATIPFPRPVPHRAHSRPLTPLQPLDRFTSPFTPHPLGSPARQVPNPFGQLLNPGRSGVRSGPGSSVGAQEWRNRSSQSGMNLGAADDNLSGDERYQDPSSTTALLSHLPEALHRLQTSLSVLHERLSSVERNQALLLSLSGAVDDGVGRRRRSSASHHQDSYRDVERGLGMGRGLLWKVLGVLGLPVAIIKFGLGTTLSKTGQRRRSRSEREVEIAEAEVEERYRAPVSPGNADPEHVTSSPTRRSSISRIGPTPRTRSLPLRILLPLLRLLRTFIYDALKLILFAAVLNLAMGIAKRSKLIKRFGNELGRIGDGVGSGLGVGREMREVRRLVGWMIGRRGGRGGGVERGTGVGGG